MAWPCPAAMAWPCPGCPAKSRRGGRLQMAMESRRPTKGVWGYWHCTFTKGVGVGSRQKTLPPDGIVLSGQDSWFTRALSATLLFLFWLEFAFCLPVSVRDHSIISLRPTPRGHLLTLYRVVSPSGLYAAAIYRWRREGSCVLSNMVGRRRLVRWLPPWFFETL
ncbi:hypothetical protein F5144DRAFT_546354 [Chaetomium tenue]|uniref:Uncharacterized protein n=1 Tax=Chaetomium tenue TaxID=1854479 RepID=A0ACB7PEX5_9PEZI|nr:hypothetical protein F5144DRAFT_546354 [Chaetomium globosum]